MPNHAHPSSVCTGSGSTLPVLPKAVSKCRTLEAFSSEIKIELDSLSLPHSSRSWLGPQSPAIALPPPCSNIPTDLPSLADLSLALLDSEVDALVGEPGFAYVNWAGEYITPPPPLSIISTKTRTSIKIINSKGHIVAVLVSMPKDISGWKLSMEQAALDIQAELSGCSFNPANLHHCCAADHRYAALAMGVSFGGGQRRPGNLKNSGAKAYTGQRLLKNKHVLRIVGFTNCLLPPATFGLLH
ncbi:unnamed protein product [Mycena citricolor]|uniref:Uncharacterized protein n=1 Tax=Mycena citricolor TaxID=2018698 RepID=A0AAD2HI00_9AGAR|nr:unnamed protein product [Mycena citricolor]